MVTGYHGLHQAAFPPSSPSGALDMGDFVAITAMESNTVVSLTLRPNQTTLPWLVDPQIVPGKPFPMKQGQVLELFTPGKSADETLSGAEIASGGKPLLVVSGMPCASIPLDPEHCGHMEDVVVPKEAFGKEYVVPALHAPDPVNRDAKVAHTIRIQAITDGTALTFEPNMLTGVTLSRGEVLEIPNVMVDVRITATVPFGVTQFVNGRRGASPDGTQIGGPSQLTAVPSSQFQMAYAFAASPLYKDNWVSIVAPTGAAVILDGQPIPSSQFKAVGASGMSVAQADLPRNDRIHSVSADKPVGIVVYGYGPNASYAYPGGLDLKYWIAAP